MSDERIISEEELDEVVGGKSGSKEKAKKTNYKCIECMKGTHVKPDNGSYIYTLGGKKTKEGYCKRGHHWNRIEDYAGYNPTECKKWFVQHS